MATAGPFRICTMGQDFLIEGWINTDDSRIYCLNVLLMEDTMFRVIKAFSAFAKDKYGNPFAIGMFFSWQVGNVLKFATHNQDDLCPGDTG